MSRIRCTQSGAGTVGPTVATFYVRDSVEVLNAADFLAFFTAFQAFYSTSVTWTVPGSGDTLDDATGELTGTWGSSGGGSVSGTNGDQWAMGVGARLVWNTNGIFSGRRVRGATFITPLPVTKYAGAGMIGSDVQTALNSAGAGLIAATNSALVIWSRPNNAAKDNGESNIVTSAQCPDLVSWLRSRRT